MKEKAEELVLKKLALFFVLDCRVVEDFNFFFFLSFSQQIAILFRKIKQYRKIQIEWWKSSRMPPSGGIH